MDTYKNENTRCHNVAGNGLSNCRGHVSQLIKISSYLDNTLESEGINPIEVWKFHSTSHPDQLIVGNYTTSSGTPSSGIIQLEYQPIIIGVNVYVSSRQRTYKINGMKMIMIMYQFFGIRKTTLQNKSMTLVHK